MSILDKMIESNNEFLGMVKSAVTVPGEGIVGSVAGESIELAGGSLSTILSEGLQAVKDAPILTLGVGAGVGGLGALLAREYKEALKTENKQIKILQKHKEQQERYKELLEEAST